MKIKVTKLEGEALNWAVAMAEGKASDCEVHAGNVLYGRVTSGFVQYRPSEDWSQGGPIIEREKVSVWIKHDHWWVSTIYNINDEPTCMSIGPTPLIAAMRCYVSSKLGNEVEVPEALCM